MKNLILPALASLFLTGHISAQDLYRNNFSNLILQSDTMSSPAVGYTTVPQDFTVISDAYNTNAGTSTNPNSPFNMPALKNMGWAVVYNAADQDTFLVSSSWLDTTGISVDRWIVTPPVSGITANSVLTWLAKSPDPSFPDGYQVYATTDTTSGHVFTAGDLLFSLSDGSTSGAGEKSTWTPRSVNLGPFSGDALRFAFHNNSRDMYQLWIDDIRVTNAQYSQDGALQRVITDKYVMTNSSNSITVNLYNNGATDITHVNLSYFINNAPYDNNEEIALPAPLSYGQNTNITFGLPYQLSSTGYYVIRAKINSINGTADMGHSNDTSIYAVTVQSVAPQRTVLIEQFLSANDGQSPDGQVKASGLESEQGIIVNIHGSDSLAVPGASMLTSDYKKEYATALIDRFSFDDNSSVAVSREDYGTRSTQELLRLSPASVSIPSVTYNSATRELVFVVEAHFVGEVKGDYRINACLTENYVNGNASDTTQNGFNQLNDFYNVPWSIFFEQGYYSPLSDAYVMDAFHYKHQNTLIYTFDGGSYGINNGAIPSAGGTHDQSFQQTFSVTLPVPTNVQRFNPDNIYIVGFVMEYDSSDLRQRRVLNAAQEKLNGNSEFVSIKNISRDAAFQVYPNPSATGLFHLNGKPGTSSEFRISDLLGNCLRTGTADGQGTLDLTSFSAGMYVLTLRNENEWISEKLIIQKK